MKIRIITIGKIKTNNLKEMINDYLNKISHFNKIEYINLEEKNFKDETSENIKKIKEFEADKIMKYMSDSYNVSLCIEGIEYDSIQFSKKLESIMVESSSSKKNLNFIIGGSYGLDDSIKAKSDLKLSFSKMTFNHQVFQLLLLEQIYRAFSIIKNISYHK